MCLPPLLIRALEGKGDLDRDGYVTGTELGLYLQREVSRYDAGQHSQYGKIRDPELDEGDFVFLLASSGALIDSPTASSQGQLTVTGNVDDAEVFVDGKSVGRTPLIALKLPAGSHRVQVKKEGYDTYRTNVEITSSRLASLEAYLTVQSPKKGRLYVTTTPSNTRVRILNIGPKFHQGIELHPGDYHVEVAAPGYGRQTRWVKLSAGEDKRISFLLSGGQTAASPSSKSKFTNSVGMTFVYIEPGTFMMGSPANEPGRMNGEGRHQVTLTQGYYLQTTEVTQAQWQRVMGRYPSFFRKYGTECPVECISWHDAWDFIQKLNKMEGHKKYRLPTEAEWEYAARAGTQTPFAFGDCLSTDQANYNGKYPMPGCAEGEYRERPIKVGSFPPNAWGLYDMHGNVSEWCQDIYGQYPLGPAIDPKGSQMNISRVWRGGGWKYGAHFCRSAHRYRDPPGVKLLHLGVRLARSE